MRTWPENVERLISIDCCRRCRRARGRRRAAPLSAGGRSPAWCRTRRARASSARRSSAGVRAADDERAQLAEIEVDRHGRRRVEQRVARAGQPHRVGELDLRAAPARARGRRRPARDRPRRRPRRARRSVPRPRRRVRRARAGSAPPPRARRWPPPRAGCSARRPRAARRTASGPSRTRRGRSRHLRARRRRRPAPAGRRARRRSPPAGAARARSRRPGGAAPRRSGARPVRSSRAEPRSFGEALSRTSLPSSSTRRSIAFADPRRAPVDRLEQPCEERRVSAARARFERAARPTDTARATARSAAGVERAPELGASHRLAHVLDPAQLRLLREVEQPDRLGRQRLAARDLVGVAGGNERERQRLRRRVSPSRPPAGPRSRGTRGRRARPCPRAEVYERPYFRSLFASMSNHIAKSVNWLPEIRSSATRTIVGVVIALPDEPQHQSRPFPSAQADERHQEARARRRRRAGGSRGSRTSRAAARRSP